jgi:ABC-type uncharacterized transport system permease subunit
MEKKMFDFINYGESILTFVIFLIAMYLNKGSEKKVDFLSIVTGLMFLYTLFGMPMVQKSKSDQNMVSYEKGESLSCISGFLFFSSTFSVKKKDWDLEENYFVNKQTKENIRVDKCESILLQQKR